MSKKNLSIALKMLSTVISTMVVTTVYAQEVVLENSAGDSYVMEVRAEESFGVVLESIKESVSVAEIDANSYKTTQEIDLNGFNIYVSNNHISVKAVSTNKAAPRNYNTPLTDQNKKDMAFIVNTLGNSSLLKLGTLKSSLESAGDRIDSVHTLQFIAYIFTNEELKTSIRNLQKSSYIWNKFINGLSESLTEDNALNNVIGFAPDFANRVGIDVNLILPSIKSGQWEKLVTILIQNLPREGDTSRYNQ